MDCDFNLQKDKVRSETVTACLQKYGICVIPNYLEGDELKKFQQDFNGFVNHTFNKRSFQIKDSVMIREDTKNIGSNYSSLGIFPKNEVFIDVLKNFYTTKAPEFSQLYAHLDKNSMEINNVWHADPTPSLKLFVYVNDVSEENGAFRYNIGSHREGYLRLIYERSAGNTTPTFVVPDDEVLFDYTIEGRAGTLVVFNTNGTHKAGEIQLGKERRVARYHSDPSVPQTFYERLVNRISHRLVKYSARRFLNKTEKLAPAHRSRYFPQGPAAATFKPRVPSSNLVAENSGTL